MIASLKKKESDKPSSHEKGCENKKIYSLRSDRNDVVRDHEESIDLSYGRNVKIRMNGEVLEITNKKGAVELSIRVTEKGPVLVFDQASIEIKNIGDFKLECDNLDIKTKKKMRVETGDDLEQRVAGNLKCSVRDDAHIDAQSIGIESKLGDLSLVANDDVAINGLRILMNVPDEKELARRKKEAKSVEDYLKLPFKIPGTPKRLPQSKPKKREDW